MCQAMSAVGRSAFGSHELHDTPALLLSPSPAQPARPKAYTPQPPSLRDTQHARVCPLIPALPQVSSSTIASTSAPAANDYLSRSWEARVVVRCCLRAWRWHVTESQLHEELALLRTTCCEPGAQGSKEQKVVQVCALHLSSLLQRWQDQMMLLRIFNNWTLQVKAIALAEFLIQGVENDALVQAKVKIRQDAQQTIQRAEHAMEAEHMEAEELLESELRDARIRHGRREALLQADLDAEVKHCAVLVIEVGELQQQYECEVQGLQQKLQTENTELQEVWLNTGMLETETHECRKLGHLLENRCLDLHLECEEDAAASHASLEAHRLKEHELQELLSDCEIFHECECSDLQRNFENKLHTQLVAQELNQETLDRLSSELVGFQTRYSEDSIFQMHNSLLNLEAQCAQECSMSHSLKNELSSLEEQWVATVVGANNEISDMYGLLQEEEVCLAEERTAARLHWSEWKESERKSFQIEEAAMLAQKNHEELSALQGNIEWCEVGMARLRTEEACTKAQLSQCELHLGETEELHESNLQDACMAALAHEAAARNSEIKVHDLQERMQELHQRSECKIACGEAEIDTLSADTRRYKTELISRSHAMTEAQKLHEERHAAAEDVINQLQDVHKQELQRARQIQDVHKAELQGARELHVSDLEKEIATRQAEMQHAIELHVADLEKEHTIWKAELHHAKMWHIADLEKELERRQAYENEVGQAEVELSRLRAYQERQECEMQTERLGKAFLTAERLPAAESPVAHHTAASDMGHVAQTELSQSPGGFPLLTRFSWRAWSVEQATEATGVNRVVARKTLMSWSRATDLARCQRRHSERCALRWAAVRPHNIMKSAWLSWRALHGETLRQVQLHDFMQLQRLLQEVELERQQALQLINIHSK
eukprot:gnl/MRDRNA2_/MRDRNA2_97749_c0_seq1.p1 gnl/MRDRNA2_/MRDRNA2_97749_c0~~gnl/MRDRNA2_/MRDRNA2_97749_c0_seq1.p1  ORF type:complete len:894 (+),score=211.58 gnl/MRDRNA2_/MRDRNA2_97749_c0_seq1:163-2844(+)